MLKDDEKDNVNDIDEHRYNIVTSGSDCHIVYVWHMMTIHKNYITRGTMLMETGITLSWVEQVATLSNVHVCLNFMASKVNVNNVNINRYNIVTGGTDCHIVHVDLKRSPVAISGAKGELVLEEVNVSCNKNTVPGDKSALNPSGVRLGTPALTTRGFKEAEMDRVVALIDSALKLAAEIQASSGPKLVDFKAALVKPENEMKLTALRNEVESFAVKFRLPGQEVL